MCRQYWSIVLAGPKKSRGGFHGCIQGKLFFWSNVFCRDIWLRSKRNSSSSREKLRRRPENSPTIIPLRSFRAPSSGSKLRPSNWIQFSKDKREMFRNLRRRREILEMTISFWKTRSRMPWSIISCSRSHIIRRPGNAMPLELFYKPISSLSRLQQNHLWNWMLTIASKKKRVLKNRSSRKFRMMIPRSTWRLRTSWPT